jgi:hypothetical protein
MRSPLRASLRHTTTATERAIPRGRRVAGTDQAAHPPHTGRLACRAVAPASHADGRRVHERRSVRQPRDDGHDRAPRQARPQGRAARAPRLLQHQST